MFDNKVFGSKIKYYREQRGLTQEKLAELSGISYSYLTDIESGTKKPSVDFIIPLLNALDIGFNAVTSDFDYQMELTHSIINYIKLLNDKELNFFHMTLKLLLNNEVK